MLNGKTIPQTFKTMRKDILTIVISTLVVNIIALVIAMYVHSECPNEPIFPFGINIAFNIVHLLGLGESGYFDFLDEEKK